MNEKSQPKAVTFCRRLEDTDFCERAFEYDLARRMAIQTAIFEDWSLLLL